MLLKLEKEKTRSKYGQHGGFYILKYDLNQLKINVNFNVLYDFKINLK